MKIAAVLLTVFCMHAGASGYSQGITLSVKNEKLENIFEAIQKQSGFRFVYKVEILNESKLVDINVKSASLKNVLDLCFKDQPLSYTIIDDIVVVSKKERKDEKTDIADISPIDVRGKVVNEKGEAISGATVSVKGTNKLTTTNENGEFFLTQVNDNAVLLVSHISFEPRQIDLEGKKELIIQLKLNISELNAVTINTGYQVLKPNETNGSVAVIDNKTFNQQTGTNVLQRLDGVTSGLYFNIGKGTSQQGTTNISIRGLSTINGPLDPLIVLDNFPYEGDINNINPNDVESVTVLKDAAATSIYGARGGNGVIVITTKRGRFNQKLKIEFASNIMVGKKPDFYSLDQISVGDYIDVEQYLFNHGYKLSDTSDINKRALTPVYEILLKRRNGQITATDSAIQIDALKATDSRDQYDKYFNRNAVIQQYALTLNGGSNNIAWIVSGTYDKSVSNTDEKNDKINLRFVNTYKPFKNLQLSLGVYYTNNKQTGPGWPEYNSIKVNTKVVPYLRFGDAYGNPLAVATKYRASYTDTAGAGHLLDWKYYPLEDYKHYLSTAKRDEIVANLRLNYLILKGLDIDINFQYQKQRSSTEDLADIESFGTRDLINRYTQLPSGTTPIKYVVPKGGVLVLSNANIGSMNFRGQMNYRKNWTAHAVSTILGTELRETVSNGGFSTLYGYNKDPLLYSAVDFINFYPSLPAGNLSAVGSPPRVNPTLTNRFISFYGNAAYTYKQRYSASVSARSDGSNIFGAATNDKWKPLWSAGLGWEISKEKFYNFSTISYLKLVATMGYSGNVDLRKTPLPVARYNAGSATVGLGLPFVSVIQLNDPSLRWETVRQTNIGLHFSAVKHRVSGSIEFYLKKGTDLYGPSAFDYTAGGTATINKNVASMKGEGVDISIASKNIDATIKWNTRLLFSYNANTTTSYYGTSAERVSTLLNSGRNITPVIGKPLYALAAYRWGGLNSSGDPQGFLNGQLSTDYKAIRDEGSLKGVDGNIIYVGPASPTFYGSVINEFAWKNFSLIINISYSLGYYFRKPAINYGGLYQFGTATGSEFENRWKKPGDESITSVPAMVYTDYPQFTDRETFYSYAEINVLKADHIRLKYINLDYTLTGKDKKFPFDQIQIYVNAANLGILWGANKQKLDPDYPFSLPPSKQFTFGLRASF